MAITPRYEKLKNGRENLKMEEKTAVFQSGRNGLNSEHSPSQMNTSIQPFKLVSTHQGMLHLFAQEVEEVDVAVPGRLDADVHGVRAELSLAVLDAHRHGGLALRLGVEGNLHGDAGLCVCVWVGERKEDD